MLIENGTYNHPWLGISARTMSPDLNKEIGLSPNFKGILVNSIVENGPAHKGGILGSDKTPHGDIITALDDTSVRNINELLSYIENNKVVGDKINITILRNNQTINDIVVTLGERPLFSYTSQYITSQTPLF